MPVNEKELNCNLLDQLSILERIERQLKKCNQEDVKEVQAEIDFIKNEVNRKLYQKPPLTDN